MHVTFVALFKFHNKLVHVGSHAAACYVILTWNYVRLFRLIFWLTHCDL